MTPRDFSSAFSVRDGSEFRVGSSEIARRNGFKTVITAEHADGAENIREDQVFTEFEMDLKQFGTESSEIAKAEL
jgi:hypothetical protein